MTFELHTIETLQPVVKTETVKVVDLNHIRLTIGHYGANFLHTGRTFKGRGITLLDSFQDGMKRYRATDKALELIESQFEVGYQLNWD